MKVTNIQSVEVLKYLIPSFLIFDALVILSLVLFLAIKGCRSVKRDEVVKVEDGKKKNKKTKNKNKKTNVKKIEVKPKQEKSIKKANTIKNKNSKKKK